MPRTKKLKNLSGAANVAEKKRIFLEEFRKCPRPAMVCRSLQLSTTALDYYLRTDPKFKGEYQQIRRDFLASVGEKAETVVVAGMLEPKNVWLALNVAERFNPDWKKVDPSGQYTQINIETALINPRASLAPTEGLAPEGDLAAGQEEAAPAGLDPAGPGGDGRE